MLTMSIGYTKGHAAPLHQLRKRLWDMIVTEVSAPKILIHTYLGVSFIELNETNE